MSPFTEFELIKELQQKGGKIVLLVLDGLGGLPMTPGGKTELESPQKAAQASARPSALV
jgi:hypothetical protein